MISASMECASHRPVEEGAPPGEVAALHPRVFLRYTLCVTYFYVVFNISKRLCLSFRLRSDNERKKGNSKSSGYVNHVIWSLKRNPGTGNSEY